MKNRYNSLISPIKVGNVVLKNRMTSTASTPHFLQGKEPYPTEKYITHFANRAKNGAAVITINHLLIDQMPIPELRVIDNVPFHFNMLDMNDYTSQNYLCQLLDAIHFYGSKAMAYLNAPMLQGSAPGPKPGPGAPDGPQALPSAGDQGGPMMGINPEIVTEKMMEAYIENMVQQSVDLKRLGFDMISIHCCYRGAPHTRFLSPLTNKRTDEYGGSFENRAKFILRIYESIKKACGKDFPLECVFSVSEPEGGYTVEDTIEFAKLADGKIDILHLRAGDMDPQHPIGLTSTEDNPTPYLDEIAQVTRVVKEQGINILIGASAGFHDLDGANKAIEQGKCDLICMARSWIVDPEYGKKAYEGRGEDVIPCIRCNKCHVSNGADMFRSICSVNPRIGLEDKLERLIGPVVTKKKVAVIGGGPAGMETALIATERGHDVTIYEKTSKLGGQLKHSDYASFKWPLRHYKDYMIRQMYQNGIRVILNTEVTKDILEREDYDVVVAAIGSSPVRPNIPGVNNDNVFTAEYVFGNESEIQKNVVIIGGGEIGVETGIHLAKLGHEVTVLEVLPELIADAPHAHYKNMVRDAWCKLENFNSICNARCSRVTENSVYYLDGNGEEHEIAADSVVLSVGSKSHDEEAMSFYGVAKMTYMVGDCEKVGNVQKAMRSGFATASII